MIKTIYYIFNQLIRIKSVTKEGSTLVGIYWNTRILDSSVIPRSLPKKCRSFVVRVLPVQERDSGSLLGIGYREALHH